MIKIKKQTARKNSRSGEAIGEAVFQVLALIGSFPAGCLEAGEMQAVLEAGLIPAQLLSSERYCMASDM